MANRYQGPHRQGAFGSSYISPRFRGSQAQAQPSSASDQTYADTYDQTGEQGQSYYDGYGDQQYYEGGYDEFGQPYEPQQQQPYDPSYDQQWQQQQQHGHQAPATGLEQPMADMSVHDQTGYPEQEWSAASSQLVPYGVAPCDLRFINFSVAAFASSSAVRLSSNLPFSVTVQPLAEVEQVALPDEDVSQRHALEGPLPCVNFTNCGVVRCKACRTYINPYVRFQDGGQSWRCCMCGRPNEVPSAYFDNLDSYGSRVDRDRRVELCMSSFEITAPAEYMVRPPQPPTFVFVVDVSIRAIQTGMIDSFCSRMLGLMDSLAEYPRARVAFITFDSTLHLYNLRPTLKRPEMSVLSNLEDLFLPCPEDFLVNLVESRSLIEQLLQSLPAMHADTRNVESALGAAVLGAYRVASPVGGKVMFFSTALPSVGPARLKNREPTSGVVDTKLLQCSSDFYKHWAVKYTRVQLNADVFLFADQYADVATLSDLTRFTGGQFYRYPNSHQSSSISESFQADLSRCLTREQSWEAVMRVRVSRGAKIIGYEGNFFLRGQDLLAVPNCDADSTFTVELTHDDESPAQDAIFLQAALLYTSSFGERRIRVHNSVIPVINQIENLFHHVDMANLVSFTAKKAINIVLEKSLAAGREHIQKVCTSILTGWRKTSTSFKPLSTYEDYPESLQMLPLMTLALLKHPAFSDSSGSVITADDRSFYISLIRMMGYPQLELLFRPTLMPVHQLSGSVGIETADGSVELPGEINLTSEEVVTDGVYLLDNGITILLWFGSAVSPTVTTQLLGLSSIAGADPRRTSLALPAEGDQSSLCSRLHTVINYLRGQSVFYQNVTLVFEQGVNERLFLDYLVYDRSETVMGYGEFLEFLANRTS